MRDAYTLVVARARWVKPTNILTNALESLTVTMLH